MHPLLEPVNQTRLLYQGSRHAKIFDVCVVQDAGHFLKIPVATGQDNVRLASSGYLLGLLSEIRGRFSREEGKGTADFDGIDLQFCQLVTEVQDILKHDLIFKAVVDVDFYQDSTPSPGKLLVELHDRFIDLFVQFLLTDGGPDKPIFQRHVPYVRGIEQGFHSCLPTDFGHDGVLTRFNIHIIMGITRCITIERQGT